MIFVVIPIFFFIYFFFFCTLHLLCQSISLNSHRQIVVGERTLRQLAIVWFDEIVVVVTIEAKQNKNTIMRSSLKSKHDM